MKRRLLIIAIFLLLGAVVNVGVAWGLSLRSWPYAKRYGFQQQLAPDQDGINWWRRHAVAGFPDTPAGMHRLHRFGYRSLALYDNAQKQESFFFAYAEAHGWPMVSLESQHWSSATLRINIERSCSVVGLCLPVLIPSCRFCRPGRASM